MINTFAAFSQGMEIGTQQRLRREQAEREAKLNALSGQAFGATDPAQVNQLAQTAAELGGAPAGAQIQAISQGQNELQNQRRNQMFETIARRVASVAQLPDGPEREAAWAAGVNEIVTDPAQRDQLLALGSQQGITAVASQIAPVGDLLAKMGFTQAGGPNLSPRVQSLNWSLERGFITPEQHRQALLVDAGLAPAAQAPGFTYEDRYDPETGATYKVAMPTRGFLYDGLGGAGAPGPMPGAPQMQPPARPASAPSRPGVLNLTAPDGRPVNINLQDFAQLEPSSRALLVAQLEQETGLALTPEQRAQLVGERPAAAPAAAPAVAPTVAPPAAAPGPVQATPGRQDAAEDEALRARRVEEERRRAQAAVEAEVNAPANERARALALENAERTRQTVRDAIEKVSGTSAGFVGARLRNIEGTQAFDLARTIDTIKANLSFGALQAMRDASPTGGALGGISENELALLGATVQSLDPNQSPEEIARKLAEVQYYYERTIARIEERDADSVPRPAGLSPAPAGEVRRPSGIVIRPRNR